MMIKACVDTDMAFIKLCDAIIKQGRQLLANKISYTDNTLFSLISVSVQASYKLYLQFIWDYNALTPKYFFCLRKQLVPFNFILVLV